MKREDIEREVMEFWKQNEDFDLQWVDPLTDFALAMVEKQKKRDVEIAKNPKTTQRPGAPNRDRDRYYAIAIARIAQAIEEDKEV